MSNSLIPSQLPKDSDIIIPIAITAVAIIIFFLALLAVILTGLMLARRKVGMFEIWIYYKQLYST